MNKHRNIHVLFSLSLFLLFVIGSFFIVTYEIKGYQVINDTCQQEAFGLFKHEVKSK